jgi:outer membrane protein assembly factor BamD (BamD/ComL family)
MSSVAARWNALWAAALAAIAATGCAQWPGGTRAAAGLPPPATSDVRPASYQSPEDAATASAGGGDSDATRADSLQAITSRLTDPLGKKSKHKANEPAAKQLYAQGEAAFRAASMLEGKARADRFVEAAASYGAAAKSWPDSALQEDALFMVAECQFFADRYAKAESEYAALMKKYPSTRHLDRVAARRFAIATYWLDRHRRDPRWILSPNLTDSEEPRFDTFGNAIKILDTIRLEDPTGKVAADATMAAANALYAARRYEKADHYYTDVRKIYPGSKHAFAAYMLGIQCKLKKYQGPDYDGAPLVEAQELIKEARKLFPREAEGEKGFLDQSAAEILASRAKRDWEVARFYERRSEYRAARVYYESIAREYPQTRLAQDARVRMAAIADRPPTPPQRLAWLAEMFEPPKKDQPAPAGQSDAKIYR